MNILQMYMKEVTKYPVLTHEEHLALFRKYKEGDLTAREILINSNLRYVISVAKSYAKSGVALEEIISAGNEGLIKAIERYDPEKGYKLSTFMIWWIRQAILTADAELRNLIRIPGNRQVDMHKAKKLEAKKIQELGRGLHQYEIENLSYYDNKHLIQLNNTISLNDLDENDHEIVGTLLPPVEDDMESDLEQEALKETIKELMQGLSWKEKDILTLYMGLDDIKPLTLESIGKLHGLSRERIRQIKSATLQKIQIKHKR